MNYEIFKEAILSILADGSKRTVLMRTQLAKMGHVADEKQIVRFIQKMRTDGFISFKSNKWYSNSLVKCERCDGKGFYAPKPNTAAV